MFCHHPVVTSACSSVISAGWNSKRSTAQPSRAGVLRSTTPSTLRQVRACSEQPAQACSCWHIWSSDRTLYHLYCVYQPVIQPLRLMRVREHAPPSSAVWTTGTRRPLLEKLLSYMMWHNMSGPLCLQEHQPSSWMPPSAPMPPWSFSSWTWLNRLWTWSHVAASPPLTGTESCTHVVVDCVSYECSCSPQTSPLSLHRYHKLVWGPYGMDSGAHPSGVLIAGGENGNVILYDPAKIMAGESDVIIAESEKHTGPVRALDVNPYQVWSS